MAVQRQYLSGFRLAVSLLVCAVTPAQALTPAPETGTCSLEGAAPATIAAIDEHFELLLDDGRRGVLSGLEFAVGDAGKAAQARLSGWLAGRDVFVGALGPGPDRWGRVPMRVYASPSDEPQASLVAVAAAMLEEGRARFRPDPSAAPCAKIYREAEAAARPAGRGLWTGEKPFEAGVEATAPLMNRKGMAIVEGTIRHVGETRSAIYLNFGENPAKSVSAMISRRNLAILQALGIERHELRGRRVRVRGLIETGFGPRLELFAPAQIEILE
jgi:Staphylococcal nuclease homologue